MISAWSEFESTEAQPDVLDAAIISMIQHMEHYEIAGYGCARAFAEVLDEAGVAELLQETLEEEEECDRRLTKLAETVVNVDAEAHSRSGLCRWILWVDLSAMLCGSVKKHEDCVCLVRERWCFF